MTTSRRAFLESGLWGGALIAARPLLGAAPADPAAAATAGAAAGAPPVAPAASAGADLVEQTLAALQADLAAGRRTSVDLVAGYQARIAALDRRGPCLAAVIEQNPDAEAIAAALDAERRARGPRGPLHGIPILIKDNIATHDRMATTAGSLALVGAAPAADAFVAARLRAAGAVLLGKTNLSEWANFRSTRSSSGWSGRGGQCRNPYALDRSPSGSSSGSAAATAASLCAAAVGTETDGSIVSPSSVCGLVGVKPTVGLLSRAGIVPIAHSQDTAGPMARTVTDAALLLGAMVGFDAADAATGAARGRAPEGGDYTRFLRPDALRGARIGIARRHLPAAAAEPLLAEAIAAMRHLGAEVIDPADIATAGRFDDSELEVLLYEFKADLNRYLAAPPAAPPGAPDRSPAGAGAAPTAPVRSLAELIAWNELHRAAEMPFFGQELLLQAAAKGPLSDPAYRKALAANHRLARRLGIDATLARHRLDAIAAPTGGPAWLIDLVNGDAPSGGSSTPAAVAGYPSVTVPAGQVFGLPVGISFFGAAWSEGRLLGFAFAFEQATRHRQAPRFLPTAELPGAGLGGSFATVP